VIGREYAAPADRPSPLPNRPDRSNSRSPKGADYSAAALPPPAPSAGPEKTARRQHQDSEARTRHHQPERPPRPPAGSRTGHRHRARVALESAPYFALVSTPSPNRIASVIHRKNRICVESAAAPSAPRKPVNPYRDSRGSDCAERNPRHAQETNAVRGRSKKVMREVKIDRVKNEVGKSPEPLSAAAECGDAQFENHQPAEKHSGKQKAQRWHIQPPRIGQAAERDATSPSSEN